MAKKSKSKKGRRRIGAAGALSANSPVVKYGSLAAGYLLSDKVQEQIDKLLGTTMDSKMINGVIAAGSLYYLFMHKGKKNLPLTAIAGIAGGAAAKGLLVDFGVMSGFSNIPVIGNYNRVPVVSGYNVPAPALNGIGNGYTVPASSVMGSIPSEADGSGINSTDR
jgi:hypothetical protein